MFKLIFKRIEPVTFCINWSGIIAASIFWLWGLNAYPAGSTLNNLFVNMVIVGFFIYFTFKYHSSYFHSEINISAKLFYIFIAITVFAIAISWRQLTQPLWGDQIYHANLAARYGQLTIYFMEMHSPSLWGLMKSWPAKYVVWAVNFLLLIFFWILFFLVPRVLRANKKSLVVVLVVMLLCARFTIVGDTFFSGALSEPAFLIHYDWDPHPTLRLFPLILSSSIFGVSEFGYRMAGFLSYLICLFFIYIRLEKQVGILVATSAAIALGTLPVFWHVGYLVEQSVWSTVAASVVLAWIFSIKKCKLLPLLPILSVALLATLLRTPAFIVCGPILVVIIYLLSKGEIPKEDRLPILMLISAIILFVLISVLRGSPATENQSLWEKISYASLNNIPAIAAASIFGLVPLFFIGNIFSLGTNDGMVKFISSTSYLLLGLLVFYVPVTQSLWGVARYQAEIYVPLVVAGVISFCITQSEQFSVKRKWLTTLPVIGLLIINVFSLVGFDARIFRPFPDNPTPGEAAKSEAEYPMRLAFDFVYQNELQRNCFYIGIYNGGYIAALMGMSASDYLAFTRLNNQYRDVFTVDLTAVDNNPQIKCLLIEPEADSGALDKLRNLGWAGKYEFLGDGMRHKMIVLTRSKSYEK